MEKNVEDISRRVRNDIAKFSDALIIHPEYYYNLINTTSFDLTGYIKRFYDTYGIEPSVCNKLKKVENCANKVSIFEYPMYKIEILVEKALGY